MNWQKKLGGTVAGRMGIPIIDGPHPHFRKILQDEPILLTERKPPSQPPPRSEGTRELSMSDLEVVVEGQSGEATAPSPRTSEATRELSTSDFELIVEGEPGAAMPPGPPPPRRQAPASEPPRAVEESDGYSLTELLQSYASKHGKGAAGADPAQEDGPDERARESSVMASLEHVQRLEEERVAQERAAQAQAKPAPTPAPEKPRRVESSVQVSMEDLRRIEAERVAEEQAAKEEAAREAQGLDDGIKSLVDEALGQADGPAEDESLLSLAGELSEEIIVETSEPFVFLEPEYVQSREISISIELVVGLPWEDEHAVYKMNEDEKAACASVLPERETRWLLPVPARDTKEKGELAILRQFSKEEQMTFNGKKYYVAGKPFAEARRVARTGIVLHIWPESATDYEYLGEVSGEVGLSQPVTGEWSINMKCHILSKEELSEYSALMPENRPFFIHPIPDSESQTVLEQSIMEGIHKEGRVPRVSLGGKDYFVFSMGSVAEWQEATFLFKNVRIASRKGEWLGIWPDSESGRELMSFRYGFESTYHGPPGPPLLDTGGLVAPYSSELPAIKRLYGNTGEKRWLYPLPARLGDFDSDTLNFLTVVSCRELELSGMSPLISLQGNWYVSLKYAHPEARASALEGGKLRVNPKAEKLRDTLAEMRARAAERREQSETPMIVLPPDPMQRKPLLDMFPEGKIRYLYYVDPKNSGYVAHRPHVALMRGKEKEVFLVLDDPHQNAIPVRRQGIAIYPLI